jgi:hypothetical protein
VADLLDHFEIVYILDIKTDDMGDLHQRVPVYRLTKSPAEDGVGATLVRKTPASFRGPAATE